ncbi:MAG: hypothetical protein JWQ40_3113 [Segetibacter sp.]|jgi:hypothetical protein|nr:hypothetical protein [Segetibacter sp.]
MRCLQAIPGLWLTSNAVSPGIPGNRQPPAGDHIYKPQAYTGQKESCFLNSGKMPPLSIAGGDWRLQNVSITK